MGSAADADARRRRARWQGLRTHVDATQRIRVAVWLAIAVISCGHAAPPAPAPPKGPTACDRAADSMVLAMLARLPAADAPTKEADGLRNLIRERCERDAWSAEATRCLIAMKTLDDAAPCAAHMTEAQQAALVRDQQARTAAPRGP